MKNLFLLLIVCFFLTPNFTAQAQIKGKIKNQTRIPAKLKTNRLKQGAQAKPQGKKLSGWNKGGEGIVNTSYTNFSQWAEGGVNTFNLVGNLNLFADYRKDKWLWENDARFSLGFTHTGANGLQKADDVIDLDSKLGYKISDKAYWSTLLTFDTQFLEGFTLQTSMIDTVHQGEPAQLVQIDTIGRSKFLSPARATLGTGIDYKPLDFISIYFSPLTAKGIIVADNQIATFAPDPANPDVTTHGNMGRTVRTELGAKLTIGIKKELLKNITLTSILDLYSNYLDRPKNIDVDWKTEVNFQVNKYIAATFAYHLKYDDNALVPKINAAGMAYQGKGLQSKAFYGIGFKYKFGER